MANLAFMNTAEKQTVVRHESGERPTIQGWAVKVISELEAQLDRLYSGHACETCKGSCEELRGGPAGVYVRTCGGCDGRGVT